MKNTPSAAVFAWSIVDSFDFSGVDCLELTRVYDDGANCYPVEDDNPGSYWSLYAHGDPKKGQFLGVDCVADFMPHITKEAAALLGLEIAKTHGLEFTP